MAEITDLKARGGKVEVCIDGAFSFSLSADVASKLNLSVGRLLSTDEVQWLVEGEAAERCFSVALRLLSYRPRSRTELKWRLLGRGFSGTLVDRVLALLEQKGYIDDAAFARFWADNRAQFKPRSARLIGLELKQKGVSAEVVDEATHSLDDEILAYQAGLKKARTLAKVPKDAFYRRLYSHLRRRGFTDGVIQYVVERLWMCGAGGDQEQL